MANAEASQGDGPQWEQIGDSAQAAEARTSTADAGSGMHPFAPGDSSRTPETGAETRQAGGLLIWRARRK